MKSILFVALLMFSYQIRAQNKPLPTWATQAYNKLNLAEKYKQDAFLKPGFFEADFNQDGFKDIALLVAEKSTNKKGLLIIHANSNQYYVIGAGIQFGTGADNYKWAGGWQHYTSKIAYETIFKDGDIAGSKKIRLSKPAIYIYSVEDGQPNAGGLIYWTGKKYKWIQQGE